MRCSHNTLATLALLSPTIYAAAIPKATPAPTPTSNIPASGLIQGLVGEVQAGASAIAHNDVLENTVNGLVKGLEEDVNDFSQAATAFAAVLTAATVSPKPAPTNFAEVQKVVKRGVYDNKPKNIFQPALEFVLNSINPFANKGLIGQLSSQINSFDNVQPARALAQSKILRKPFFPQAEPADAPYSLAEAVYRKGIHIPDSFTYGQKKPVILIPGTGSTGGDTFAGNMIPLMTASDFADPVWLNIPGYLLDDAQVSAEYVAYAIHYINNIAGNKGVTLMSWSQGGIDAQWALKYWPSTRPLVHDLVAASPDYHGTVLANFLSPGFPLIPMVGSVMQQENNSSFIGVLRLGDGDSAFVPTTNVYSSFFDEIVEPQTGNKASAFLKDVRNVGVTNNEVQAICNGKLAGSFYTHEGVLYNPLTFALLKDAMTNDGPGRYERLDLNSICPLYATEGLSLTNVLDTEALIPQAALNIVLTFPKGFEEPSVKTYAYPAQPVVNN